MQQVKILSRLPIFRDMLRFMKRLNQRVCAVCGNTDAESKSATTAFPFWLMNNLAERTGIPLKFAESGYAHPKCISKLQGMKGVRS